MAVIALLLTGLGCSDDTPETPETSQATTTAQVPSSAGSTIADYLAKDPELSTLAALVTGTDAETTLSGPGPITFFAPINTAFDALPKGTVDGWKDDGSLDRVLGLHIVDQQLTADKLVPMNGKTLATTTGSVTVAIDGRVLLVGGAPVTRTDVMTSNGVIHLVGKVITRADG